MTFCPFTTNPIPAPLFRLPVRPSDSNGLKEGSSLMVDKITTVARARNPITLQKEKIYGVWMT